MSTASTPLTPVSVALLDGRPAEIRELRSDDREALDLLHDQVSSESLRLRFFTANRAAGHRYVDHLIAGTGDTVCALVATASTRVVALATAERLPGAAAEVAFLVADDERGHGVGTHLLLRLVAECRARGVRKLVAEVLPENHRMVEVFRDAGLPVVRRADPGLLHYEISTEEVPRAPRSFRPDHG